MGIEGKMDRVGIGDMNSGRVGGEDRDWNKDRDGINWNCIH